jgi:hypothetical protein
LSRVGIPAKLSQVRYWRRHEVDLVTFDSGIEELSGGEGVSLLKVL